MDVDADANADADDVPAAVICIIDFSLFSLLLLLLQSLL